MNDDLLILDSPRLPLIKFLPRKKTSSSSDLDFSFVGTGPLWQYLWVSSNSSLTAFNSLSWELMRFLFSSTSLRNAFNSFIISIHWFWSRFELSFAYDPPHRRKPITSQRCNISLLINDTTNCPALVDLHCSLSENMTKRLTHHAWNTYQECLSTKLRSLLFELFFCTNMWFVQNVVHAYIRKIYKKVNKKPKNKQIE